jgi:hypothetical protein
MVGGQRRRTNWEAMELVGEKAIESAKTLLSIGFEIKPC